MKVLIIEPENKGHHFILYINKILNEFKKKNYRIDILTSKKTINSVSYKLIKKKYGNFFKTYSFNYNLSLKKNFFFFKVYFQLMYFFIVLKNTLKLNKKNNYDIIYFNHLDPFFYAYSIFGYFINLKKISGLLLNCKFHHSYFKFNNNYILDFIKLFLFKLTLKNKKIFKIFIIDYLIKDFLKIKKIKSKKLVYINEAYTKMSIRDKFYSRRKLKLNTKRKYILVYGAIGYRKGLIHLLETIYSDKKLEKYSVIIAGIIEKDLLIDLKKRNSFQYLKKKKKIYIFNKFITENDEDLIFNATDYVWLGYNSLGSDSSSGVLNLSIMSEKILIASNRGLIGNIVKKNKLGYIFSSNLKSILIRILEEKKTKNIYQHIKSYKSKIISKPFEKSICSNF